MNLSKNMPKDGETCQLKWHESFKEYAKKWRDLTAQVAPPMTGKEMITIIADTLPVFYYEKWWGTHLQALLI